MANRWGNNGNSDRLFSWAPKSLQTVATAIKLKVACSLEEKPWQTYQWTSEISQLCPTLCDPMDCSLPASSIHGIFQARVLEWVAISFSRGSSQPREDLGFPAGLLHCRQTLYIWATKEEHIKKQRHYFANKDPYSLSYGFFSNHV